MKRDVIAEAESKSRCSSFQVDVSDTIAKTAESVDLKMATNCCALSRVIVRSREPKYFTG